MSAALAAVLFFSVVITVAALYRIRDAGIFRSRALGVAVLITAAGILFIVWLHFSPSGLDTYSIGRDLVSWILGWSLTAAAVTGAWRARQAISRSLDAPPKQASRLMPLIVALVSVIVLSVAGVIVAGRSAPVIDEMLYVLQARLFSEPRFSLSFPPELTPFFMLRQATLVGGRMLTQYPPGWPAVLALFDSAGLLRLAGPILGAASVALTYAIGLRLHSWRAGLIASGLLLSQPWFLETQSRYWSHSASTFFLLVAAFLLVGDRSDQKPEFWRWIGVGLSLGAAFATRPLTAATVGAALGLWYLFNTRADSRRTALKVVIALIGALPAIVATGYYNEVTTGHYLQFGYGSSDTPLGSLGFGSRGYIAYDRDGVGRVVSEEFSFADAVAGQARVLSALVLTLLPAGLLAPFLFVAQPWRVRARALIPFLFLPIGYFFWSYSTLRFYVEMFPYAFVGIAILYERLRKDRPALARKMGIFLLAVTPAAALGYPTPARDVYERCRRATHDVDRLAQDGRVLLFVKDARNTKGSEILLECLYLFNTKGLQGQVVVARDLGGKNGLLMQRYPDYRPMRIEWDSKRNATSITAFTP